jgi:hypothetical protein
LTVYSKGRTCSASGTEKKGNIILFAKPNRLRLLARVDVKIILDRISEKQNMAVWTTFLQRGAGRDVWSLTPVSDQSSQNMNENTICCLYRSNVLMMKLLVRKM